MANTTSHGNLSLGTENIHAFIRWIHEDATERASETVTADDLGKVSWQKDTDSFYCLIGTTPTWKNIGSGGAVLGNGTVGKLSKWVDVDTLGDSIISESGDTVTITGTNVSLVFQSSPSGQIATFNMGGNDGWFTLNTNLFEIGGYVRVDSVDNTNDDKILTLDSNNQISYRTNSDILSDIGALANVVDDTSPQLGGELDCQAHSVGFTLQTATGSGTTTIDWTNGNKAKFTFGAQNETFTFTNPSKPCSLMLILVQDSVGGRTATFPSGIKWFNKTEPTLSTDANAEDILALFYDGTSYYASLGLNFGVTA